jgi:hypothetical protein
VKTSAVKAFADAREAGRVEHRAKAPYTVAVQPGILPLKQLVPVPRLTVEPVLHLDPRERQRLWVVGRVPPLGDDPFEVAGRDSCVVRAVDLVVVRPRSFTNP